MSSFISFIQNSTEAHEENFLPSLIKVYRTQAEGLLAVAYQITGSAIPGRDYVNLSGKLSFAAGQSEASILVKPLTNYRNTRKNETVVLTLEPSEEYSVGDVGEVTVTILHDPSRKHLPSDEHFFATLTPNPRLSGVTDAVACGDYATARAQLAAHFRAPRGPVFPHESFTIDYAVIDAALQHSYTVFGITHSFSWPIDWSATEVSDPNYCWGFNRMEWWPHYAAAYVADPVKNERYALALFAELADWLISSPVSLTYYPLQPGDRWRHLEVAIRSGYRWPVAFSLLKNSPLLSDDLLVDWIKSFYVHARHLEVNAELFTNRGSGEATALYVLGILFPEFADSADWIRLGIERMEGMLRHDVMPDGVENEFSPNYHSHVAEGIVKMHQIAVSNGRTLTPFIEHSCAQLFDYLTLASEPSFTLPHLNDSCYTDVPKCLALAAQMFPDRGDYRWFASRGKEGNPPSRTSHLFPDAGHVVMRSDWGTDACYLMMDAGPFGTSHGHEDCLSLSISGYGVRHLIDCGPYNYEETHPYRLYSVRSHGKTMPLIDDLDQNRKSALSTKPGMHPNVDVRVGEPVIAPPRVWTHSTPVVWRTSKEYDYAAGTYGKHADEVWGSERLRPAEITRHIFFLKPNVWVVIEDFRPLDDQAHIYSGLFQCNADEVLFDAASQRVTIQLQPGQFDPDRRVVIKTLQPSLTITPLPLPSLSLQVVKGQDEPSISGYQFEKNTDWLIQPIPTVRYDLPPTEGNVQMAYVLAAAPAEATILKPTITKIATAPSTFGLRVSVGDSSIYRTILIALDGQILEWEGQGYQAPSLIITPDGIHDWSVI